MGARREGDGAAAAPPLRAPDVEFVDGSGRTVEGTGSSTGDVLEVRSVGPRWLRPRAHTSSRTRLRFAIAIAVLITGVAVLVQRPDGRGADTAGAPSRSTAAKAPPQAADASTSSDFAAVLALAHHRGRLTDYVRQDSPAGSCAPVRVGYSPVGAIVRTATRYVPTLVVIDSSRTLDQFTGLCAVAVRASVARAAVLTISVSAPPARPPRGATSARIETGIITSGQVTTKYVSVVTTTGRQVVVGDTGPSAAAVPIRDLLTLAQAPALAW